MKSKTEFNTAVDEVAQAKLELDLLEAKLKKELALVQGKYAQRIQLCKDLIKKETAKCARFAGRTPSVFSEKNTGESAHAIFKFLTIPKVLKPQKGFTWPKVLELIQGNKKMSCFLRLNPEVDRERIKNEMKKTHRTQMDDIGVQLVDEHKFVIEPKPKTQKGSS